MITKQSLKDLFVLTATHRFFKRWAKPSPVITKTEIEKFFEAEAEKIFDTIWEMKCEGEQKEPKL
jgi:hypothetical protein